MDPRNYLNEKYIFAFESLGYSNNQTSGVISSIISGQKFFGKFAQKMSVKICRFVCLFYNFVIQILP